MLKSRDLYLINAFWGPTYRRWFTDFFLRSLLSPGNLAAVDRNARNKMLLATTNEDWLAIREHSAMKAIAAYFEVVFYPIDGLSDRQGREYRTSTYEYVARVYAPLLERAYADKALGLMLSPDLMVSDGFLSVVRRRIDCGANMVFIPAWRSDQAKLMAGLQRLGLLDSRAGQTDQPIVLPPRGMARVLAESLHDLEGPRLWDDNRFSIWPSYTFWPVPGNGYVIFGMSGVPFVDYAQVTWHNVDGLGPASLDAYPTMFGFAEPKVEVIADSDEAVIASWTPPNAEAWAEFRPRWRMMIPGLRDFARMAVLRAYAQHVFFWGRNRLNRAAYPLPIRLHAEDIDANWEIVERRARQLTAAAIGDLFPIGAFGPDVRAPVGKRFHPWWLVMRLGSIVFAYEQVIPRNLGFVWQIAKVLGRALCGADEDRLRIWRRLQKWSGQA